MQHEASKATAPTKKPTARMTVVVKAPRASKATAPMKKPSEFNRDKMEMLVHQLIDWHENNPVEKETRFSLVDARYQDFLTFETADGCVSISLDYARKVLSGNPYFVDPSSGRKMRNYIDALRSDQTVGLDVIRTEAYEAVKKGHHCIRGDVA